MVDNFELIKSMFYFNEANDMFFRLVKELAQKDGITEVLKATDQMEWVRRMNAVRKIAEETVYSELIYS